MVMQFESLHERDGETYVMVEMTLDNYHNLFNVMTFAMELGDLIKAGPLKEYLESFEQDGNSR